MFLDSSKPITTCVSEDCSNCKAGNAINCHFKAKELIHFLILVFPSFLLGGAGIYHLSGLGLGLWLTLCFSFFAFIEIRVLCSHCPHYAESGNSLKCWANYGSRKLWKYRPGPMSLGEKFSLLGGFFTIWGYPLIFLISGKQWLLLIVYMLTTSGFFMTLKLDFCPQCMNFACPLNEVKEEARQDFFKKNPVVAEAWGVDLNALCLQSNGKESES